MSAPFLATTTYEIWMRLPGQEWRLWERGFVEEHHATDRTAILRRQTARGVLSARKWRVARHTMTIEWLAGEGMNE